ncbi:ABC transporter ATP-binding protein [Geodermatophilus sabuli]|uniref:ABC-2 type transport system ATP-binding protein n=1 Tax=Geodermatophilus sabuli TaxID=1564158 RepID=A0A285EJD4_9ACTN|nr:ATP-binding cassette domain-containing protein [Geodermatophilus sabuli]MBB3083115.1 ABC-2 type transport system ATP-binding protein [Geodermatophilus sabuli]SNX98111.1 ABC-2 type transport system ATP-binding protein [Geodermatophilus sabuli]
MAAIRTLGLRKVYGGTAVLDGVDLEVARGSVCALLGPNGAGKTTAVRIMTTLLRPDGGTVEVAGLDVVRRPRAVRRRLGMVGQQPAVDEVLGGRQNLVLFARLHHLDRRAARRRAGELLAQVGLGDVDDRPVRQFSGGMRRRLDIAAALVLAPEVLFLDEPTTGLDPAGRRDVWDAVRTLVAGGTTVLLTTQYLEEAEHLADDVCVLDRGRVAARGTPRELTAAIGGDRLELVVSDPARAAEAAALAERAAAGPAGGRPRGGARQAAPGRSVVVPVDRRPGVVGDVVRALDGAGIDVDDLVLRPTTLDEAYLRITGHARAEVPA